MSKWACHLDSENLNLKLTIFQCKDTHPYLHNTIRRDVIMHPCTVLTLIQGGAFIFGNAIPTYDVVECTNIQNEGGGLDFSARTSRGGQVFSVRNSRGARFQCTEI